MIFERESTPNSEGQYLLNLFSIINCGSTVRMVKKVEKDEKSEKCG